MLCGISLSTIFQTMQFPHDRDYQEKIRTTKACRDIKRLGGNREIKLRPDWEDVKEDVMMIALRANILISRHALVVL
ncbi:MAG: hypothetical protein ACKPKO_18570, partial [Candidatus Fonsibacter sp.]